MKKVSTSNIISWIFGIIVFTIGLLNLFLVHPVPGLVFLLLSFIYYPPVNDFLRKKFGFSIPLAVKIIQGILIIWFTLGVSDLGDMIACTGSQDNSVTKIKFEETSGGYNFLDILLESMTQSNH